MTASPIAARQAVADEIFMTRLGLLLWVDRSLGATCRERRKTLTRQSQFDRDVVRNAFGIAELDGNSTLQTLLPHAAIGHRVSRPDIDGVGQPMPIEGPLFHRRIDHLLHGGTQRLHQGGVGVMLFTVVNLAAVSGLGHDDGCLRAIPGLAERHREAGDYLLFAPHPPSDQIAIWQQLLEVNQQAALACVSKSNDVRLVETGEPFGQ